MSGTWLCFPREFWEPRSCRLDSTGLMYQYLRLFLYPTGEDWTLNTAYYHPLKTCLQYNLTIKNQIHLLVLGYFQTDFEFKFCLSHRNRLVYSHCFTLSSSVCLRCYMCGFIFMSSYAIFCTLQYRHFLKTEIVVHLREKSF